MTSKPKPSREIVLASTVSPSPALMADIRRLIDSARQRVAAAVNAELTMLYWHVGRRINAEFLKGERAEYGGRIVASLAERLTLEYGKGWGERQLRYCLRLTETFPDERIVNTLCSQFSWSHLRLLMLIDDGTHVLPQNRAINVPNVPLPAHNATTNGPETAQPDHRARTETRHKPDKPDMEARAEAALRPMSSPPAGKKPQSAMPASAQSTPQSGTKSGTQSGTQSGLGRDQVAVLRKALAESSIIEPMVAAGRTNRTKFRAQVVNPLLAHGLLQMTIPDKPTSCLQKYRITDKGKTWLNEHGKPASRLISTPAKARANRTSGRNRKTGGRGT